MEKTQRNGLCFDNVNHIITYNNQSLSLNPLSFKLLKVLTYAGEQTLSVENIISEVWQNTTVSTDTLKQRVFVLRKSIRTSGIEGIIIQSVRGEGYRLVFETNSKEAIEQSSKQKDERYFRDFPTDKFKVVLVAFIVIALMVLMAFFFSKSNKEYINNRVVLWVNMKQDEMPETASTIYAQWSELLTKNNAENKIHLVLSEKQQEVLVPVQARRNRVGLISYFEVIKINGKPVINLSIIEPKTATILRTSSLDSPLNLNTATLLNSHLNSLLKLISSGKLNLTKQQKEDPKHHIWQHLKELANQT